MNEGKPLKHILLIIVVYLIIMVLPYSITCAAVPTISGITPDSGTDVSTTDITITGANFEPGAKVSLIQGGPFPVGSYDTPGDAYGVFVSGDYAYVADYGSGLHIINISDPSNPALAGSYDTPGEARSVHVSGNYAYVADQYSGLQIINITNPSSPYLEGTLDTQGKATRVQVIGNYAYLTESTVGLHIVNVSDPSSPFVEGTYNIPT